VLAIPSDGGRAAVPPIEGVTVRTPGGDAHESLAGDASFEYDIVGWATFRLTDYKFKGNRR
jgi:hypothetical protein